MEAVLLCPSPDQSISPNYRYIKSTRKNNRPFISRPSDQNIAPSNFYGGLLQAPPPSLSSYPPSSISLRHQQPQQPPLLPLPLSKPLNHHRSRGLSCPQTNRKTGNRSRDQSLTPKKSAKAPIPKKHDPKPEMKPATETAISSGNLTGSSIDPLGPDPKELPKNVSRVLSSIPCGNYINLEKFSGSTILTVSPPPSSLPLPTFSLRPKLSCMAEAGGIDDGATDNLRRLLRLR